MSETENYPAFSLDGTLASSYFWRGLALSKGPGAQLSAEIQHQGWSFGLWSYLPFKAYDARDLDLYLAYTLKAFTFTLNDYFYLPEAKAFSYFDYRAATTEHVVEMTIAYDCSESFPFRLLAGVNLYGDEFYTTYWEISWLYEINKFGTEVFLGGTPQKGYYHEEKYGPTSIGTTLTANLREEKFLLPAVSVTLAYNPLFNDLNLYAFLKLLAL